MKICLLYPPNSQLESCFPVGLLSIASAVHAKGHDVTVVDVAPLISIGLIKWNDYIYSNIANYLSDNISADVYGFSTISTLEIPSLQIAKCLKSKNHRLNIVFGNQWASMNDVGIMNSFDYIDCIVRGEGEVSFCEYIMALKNNRDMRNVAGITFRSSGDITRNKSRPLLKNLNVLPHLKYELLHFPLECYGMIAEEPLGLIEYGRGCMYKCKFCTTSTYWCNSARTYSHERVICEINHLKSHGYQHFMFTLDNMGSYKRDNYSLLRKLYGRYGGKIRWSARCRFDCMDDSALFLMNRAGCDSVLVGAESGSNYILRKTNKNISVSDILSGVKKMLKHEITPVISFVVGLPYETRATAYQTMVLACRLSMMNCYLVASIHFCSPLPGAEVTHESLKRKEVLFSDNPRIAPDFAHYLEWAKPTMWHSKICVRLPEDQLLIDKHPNLFTSFGYFKNARIKPEYFVSLCTYFNLLVQSYPITLLIILYQLNIERKDFLLDFESFSQGRHVCRDELWCIRTHSFLADRLRKRSKLHRLFGHYVNSLRNEHQTLDNVYEYESMILRANNKMSNCPPIRTVDLFSRRCRNRVAVNGELGYFSIDILALVECIEQKGYLQKKYDATTPLQPKKTFLFSKSYSDGVNNTLIIYSIDRSAYKLLKQIDRTSDVDFAISYLSRGSSTQRRKTQTQLIRRKTQTQLISLMNEIPGIFVLKSGTRK